jgi:predicted RNA-binding Zn-ribbon protein involved in translation (DUF1610 family)
MVTEPESMEDLVYFTNRTIDNGKIKAWVYRKECPKCHKAKMGKPVEKGKVKTRAKEYVCPECGFTEDKKTHEDTLIVEAKYTCPYCGNEGEATTEYKRKSFEGVQAYVFECGKCGKKIGITKKMKEGKK